MSIKGMVAALRKLIDSQGGWKWPTLRIFDDASGQGQWAGTGQSCRDILTEELRAAGIPFQAHARTVNPHVADRVNAMNAALCNARGDVRYRIHPRCTRLINDLKYMKWDGNELEKKDRKMSHASDGAGYRISLLFPIRKIERVGAQVGTLMP
jgi:hypothetical protein